MPASTDLTDLAAVKAYLGLDSGEHDTRLAALISAASEAIELYCNRPFASAERTEYHDGGRRSIVLRVRPVAGVTSVHDDPALAFAAGAELSPSAYTLDPDAGVLHLLFGRRFQEGVRSVRVVYTAGFVTVPPAVQQAANVLVSFFHHRGRQGADGIASENMGSYVVSYDTGDWPHQARGLLQEFREFAL